MENDKKKNRDNREEKTIPNCLKLFNTSDNNYHSDVVGVIVVLINLNIQINFKCPLCQRNQRDFLRFEIFFIYFLCFEFATPTMEVAQLYTIMFLRGECY
jgi:uncharacterized membrane protein YkgB